LVENGNDNFGYRKAAASNVHGKFFDIGYEQALLALPSGATYPFAKISIFILKLLYLATIRRINDSIVAFLLL